ncbi:hypothetical protein DFQ28_009699 [Apophysomyces sp. BC1034]|nr:hypothetical protein DFQ30_008645 [Apophysomyces sp. BC1015]KAG0173983.1 hypothetical protein DFQ29_007664 [Apophysomyces sp. BC1021]KAG0185216.1 hypothetical protein DFQ28_009699 [Apophysomyces sp. BC1034]
MSPRQVANKAYKLACTKLDRDEKRRRPQYTIRERVLLFNTITKAEDVLSKRAQRFNRRVLSSEQEDDSLPLSEPKPSLTQTEEKVQEQDTLIQAPQQAPIISTPLLPPVVVVVKSVKSNDLRPQIPDSTLLPRDCRPIMTHNLLSTPMTAAII